MAVVKATFGYDGLPTLPVESSNPGEPNTCRSTKPYSIDAFEEITSEDMTYPQPWQLDRGMINLFTKYTGVRELYFETSADGYTWTGRSKVGGHSRTRP